jgi:hypothetical protein
MHNRPDLNFVGLWGGCFVLVIGLFVVGLCVYGHIQVCFLAPGILMGAAGLAGLVFNVGNTIQALRKSKRLPAEDLEDMDA